ncbi:hypothetical protein CEXT_649561 [Caerostris extrusa]|uniref:Uncharacterized protein n=1 Tax=Caerostris extrusa TaxID=172846 RepID=A0AAV4VI84_CAEEX|nr:hypothetical protein CEXT_649561 [Caerostris extrusa]
MEWIINNFRWFYFIRSCLFPNAKFFDQRVFLIGKSRRHLARKSEKEKNKNVRYDLDALTTKEGWTPGPVSRRPRRRTTKKEEGPA